MVKPAWGIRRTNVKHLFDMTANLNAAVSKDGRIYVVDGLNHKIRVFNHQGNYISSFGTKGSGNGEFRFPLGIDVDGSGQVYIADSGNHRVQIFKPNGNYIAEMKIPSKNGNLSDPTDVVVDDSRNRCYIVDNDNHRILVYDLATLTLIDTYGTPGTDKRAFRYPFLITLNKAKYLYIVDVINTRVQVLNPDGLFVAFIGGWGVEKGEFFRPKGVAIDKESRVFVSDSYMGIIQVFDSNGEFHAVVGDPEKGAVKKFVTPTGLFIDNHNRLYVVEMLANKVSVYHIEDDVE
ncbi:MAG: NHL repeat-containing protein [Deltaproteobacteria bacterium]|nr:NHL repeat-containing protein [Deltaproteobacteria bacterium]